MGRDRAHVSFCDPSCPDAGSRNPCTSLSKVPFLQIRSGRDGGTRDRWILRSEASLDPLWGAASSESASVP
jgi:hypothetical protein